MHAEVKLVEVELERKMRKKTRKMKIEFLSFYLVGCFKTISICLHGVFKHLCRI